MTTANLVSNPPPATSSESVLQKIMGFFIKVGHEVKIGIEDVFGSAAGEAIITAGEQLLASDFGPVALVAVQDAVDVTKQTLNINTAVSNVLSAAKAAGKQMTNAAALQVVALLQNQISALLGTTVTPVS